MARCSTIMGIQQQNSPKHNFKEGGRRDATQNISTWRGNGYSREKSRLPESGRDAFGLPHRLWTPSEHFVSSRIPRSDKLAGLSVRSASITEQSARSSISTSTVSTESCGASPSFAQKRSALRKNSAFARRNPFRTADGSSKVKSGSRDTVCAKICVSALLHLPPAWLRVKSERTEEARCETELRSLTLPYIALMSLRKKRITSVLTITHFLSRGSQYARANLCVSIPLCNSYQFQS